jgi:hypothetical protein
MITISLHLDPDSPQDVAQAQRILDRLDDAPAATTAPAAQSVPEVPSPQPIGSPESVAAEAVADLWSRIGLSLRELVKASAEPEGKFSLRDLAEALGQPPNSIRSRFANLGRSIKATREAVPAAPPLYEEAERRDGLWYFTMPKAFRDVILRTDVAEPYSDGSLPT